MCPGVAHGRATPVKEAINMKKMTIVVSDETRTQIEALVGRYRDMSSVVEAAVALWYRLHTWEEARTLALDADVDIRDLVGIAIRALWEREFGQAVPRDLDAELDALAARVAALEAKS